MKKPLAAEIVRKCVSETLCSTAEVKRIWSYFCKADKQDAGVLRLDDVITLPELKNNPFARRIAELCSGDSSGALDFHDLVKLFSVFHPRASTEAKAPWAFAIWDFDGDDTLGASDLRQGLWLLANGRHAAAPHADDDALDLFGSNPAMFEDEVETRPTQDRRRQSHFEDLLSPHEISQVMQRIAAEIEPCGNGIAYDEFKAVVTQLPEFSFYLTIAA